jgi:hypothetical protein
MLDLLLCMCFTLRSCFICSLKSNYLSYYKHLGMHYYFSSLLELLHYILE